MTKKRNKMILKTYVQSTDLDTMTTLEERRDLYDLEHKDIKETPLP